MTACPIRPPVHSRRRLVLAGIAAGTALAAWLTGCAGVGGPPVITLSERQLAARIAQRFPIQHSVAGLVELQARDPQLRLLPERNRLELRLTLWLRDRLSGQPVELPVAFDTALRWEPADQTVRLTQPQVQPASDSGMHRATAWIVARLLDDRVAYQLDATQAQRLQTLGLEPGAVTVTARGVEVTLRRRADPVPSQRS